jgi:protein-tyrosine phosphatase
VIDLRTPYELRDTTYPPLPSLGARSLPMFERLPDLPAEPAEPNALMVDLYMTMLEIGAPTITAVLELLAEPESYPVAFYCAAGKDRTGVMTAVVLGLLGVDEEQVVRDYALSDAPVDSLKRWLAANHPDRHDPVPAGVYRAPAETMRSFLAEVEERYGSMRGYVASIGVPDPIGKAIARNLLAAKLG